MILIDTSAWVEFLRDTGSAVCNQVEALLDRGADPKLRDGEGKLPVEYAAENAYLKNTDMYRRLPAAR